jgi:chaperonin GroES
MKNLRPGCRTTNQTYRVHHFMMSSSDRSWFVVVIGILVLLAMTEWKSGYAFVIPTTSTTSSSTTTTTTSTTTALASTLSPPPPPTTTTTEIQSSTEKSFTLDGNEIRGPLTPLGNLIIVKVKETLSATSGGILLPDQSKQRPTEGVVLNAGPGKLHPFTAVRITNPINNVVSSADSSVMMSVLYGKFDGRAVQYNGNECQMIRDDDVLLYYPGVTMKLETVVPVRDYVLIALPETVDQSIQTSSGIVIAAQVVKDDVPCQGMVVKVGEGRMASHGQLCTSPVTVGDLVKFKDYAGNEIYIEGKPYSIVKMVDILCTMTPEKVTTTTTTRD